MPNDDYVLQEIEALMPICPVHNDNLLVDQGRPEFVAKCRLKECEYGILKAQPGTVQDRRFVTTEEKE